MGVGGAGEGEITEKQEMTGKGRAETWDGEAGTEESQGSEGHSGGQRRGEWREDSVCERKRTQEWEAPGENSLPS